MQHLNDMQKLKRAAFLGMVALVIITGAFWGITVLIARPTIIKCTVNDRSETLRNASRTRVT